MINNIFLQDADKKAIEFFLRNIELSGHKLPVDLNELIQYINNSEAVVEKTRFYCIIKFHNFGKNFDVFDKIYEMQVLHKDAPPTVFHMYFKDNYLAEFEFFNADSSELIEQRLFVGKVLIMSY